MAEAVGDQPMTLADRIAALNQQKNFQAPGRRPPPPPPPPPPNRVPSATAGGKASLIPSVPSRATWSAPAPAPAPEKRPAPPPLPHRTTAETGAFRSSAPGPPSLPRRPSQASLASQPPPVPGRSGQKQLSPPPVTQRRGSSESVASLVSTVSSLSLNPSAGTENQAVRRLPPTFNNAKLPPLPPVRREREQAAAAAQAQQGPPPAMSRITDPQRPSLPPRLPSRPASRPAAPTSASQAEKEPSPALPARRLPPPPAAYKSAKSALELGFGGRRPVPSPAPAGDDALPPLPPGSRPTLAEVNAASARSTMSSATASPALAGTARNIGGSSCLTCRDFTAPDSVAAQYPLRTVPRDDPVGYLAHMLCSPFSSPTDKARAIFTWFHHNMAYDAEGFFAGCAPRGLSPADQILSGMGVCEGYARSYEAIALRAGLECVVIGGHGKGLGFTAVAEGQPPPPRKATGHAWNAVRIAGGEWKLLDPCWGAGHMGADRQYHKKFSPEHFCATNEAFGRRHFPEDPRYFFREDGRVPSWEEYILGPVDPATGRAVERAQWYGSGTEEGLDQDNFTPAAKQVAVRSGEVVRFMFAKMCEHWTAERNGKGKQMFFALQIHGIDGRNDDLVPLDHDGSLFWADVSARDLGAPGQQATLLGLTQFDGRDARGLTKDEFLRRKGRCGWASTFIASWDLV